MSLTLTALSAVTILTPYVTQAGEKVAEKLGESLFNQAIHGSTANVAINKLTN